MLLQQQISLKQAALPSLGIVALGGIIWYFSDLELSLLGSTGIWSIPLGVICGTLIYVITFYFSCYFLNNLPSLRELFLRLHGLFSHLSWPGIILLSCSAGVGEELITRGLLQTWLVGHLGVWNGVILASLIFGLMHAMTRLYVIVTFLLGAIFGLLYVLSDSLLLVMLTHAVYDIFAFAVIVKYPHLLELKNARRPA